MLYSYPLRMLFLLLSFGILAAGTGIYFYSGMYVEGAFCTLGIIICVFLIFHYINSVNRKISYFFSALKNEDYTLRFPEIQGMKSEKLLNKLLNQTKEILQKTVLNSFSLLSSSTSLV